MIIQVIAFGGLVIKEILGRPNPVDGEARAVLCALEVAKAQKWPRVMIEGDCLLVINILSDGSRTLASFGAILDSCIVAFFNMFFSSISFHFIKRSGNPLAHTIAKNALL